MKSKSMTIIINEKKNLSNIKQFKPSILSLRRNVKVNLTL